jgi:hypothetical protein
MRLAATRLIPIVCIVVPPGMPLRIPLPELHDREPRSRQCPRRPALLWREVGKVRDFDHSQQLARALKRSVEA